MTFEIELNGIRAWVTRHQIRSTVVYHIVYANGMLPLTITRAAKEDGSPFWTSVPQGRQAEAELAGKAIASFENAGTGFE